MTAVTCEGQVSKTADSHKMFKYRGRFAPSPSGPLHLGSLFCALASFLDARANDGVWLIRIEDVDITRCDNHHANSIIDTLAIHGMQSDAPILTQSHRFNDYQICLNELIAQQRVYACSCTRKQIKERGGHYDGHCKRANHPFSVKYALRLDNQNQSRGYTDLIQQNVEFSPSFSQQDFILKRRDGCFAYNLAVVLDDIEQNITHVVRGSDLIDTTVLQRYLFELFDAPIPEYAHLPVLSLNTGQKLSKQNHAPAIENRKALQNVRQCLALLGFNQELMSDFESIDSTLQFAQSKWDLCQIEKRRELIL